jgi:hypothetical protein
MKRLTELVEGPFRRTGRRAIREQNTPREKMRFSNPMRLVWSNGAAFPFRPLCQILALRFSKRAGRPRSGEELE